MRKRKMETVRSGAPAGTNTHQCTPLYIYLTLLFTYNLTLRKIHALTLVRPLIQSIIS